LKMLMISNTSNLSKKATIDLNQVNAALRSYLSCRAERIAS
jgi:hypothetical protein